MPTLALPVQVDQDSSRLLVRSEGITLFEVAPLKPEELLKLKSWLRSPPEKLDIHSEANLIKGLPVDLVVNEAIATRWKSEPKGLSDFFAARLRKAVSDRTPRWSASSQLIPLHESREVRLKFFSEKWGLQVSSTNPEVVKLETLGGGRYRLRGLKAGRGSLEVTSRSGLKVRALPLVVKPWAARWGNGPGRLSFWGEVSQKRVDRALRRWLSARSLVGAKTHVSLTAKQPGGAFSYSVGASAPGAISVHKKISVETKSVRESRLDNAEKVVLSNHPERLVSDGILFERTVDKTPLRFMWHHRNDPASVEDRYLVFQLTNPSEVSRRLRILWYSYGPSPDEIHVGHTAALDFAQAGVLGQGEELVLPAKGTRTIEVRRVKIGQTMSGMAYFADVDGPVRPLGIKVLATSGRGPLPTNKADSSDPGRTASGVFPASIETDGTHVLGGPFTYLEFGGEPYERDVTEGHPSYGNFGTVYRTRLVLENPGDSRSEASLGFASGGGAARGVMSLDGELYNLPLGITGDGIPIRKYTLAPGEIRQVDVELFPQAGSNYPVRLVVRSKFERREGKELEALRPLRSYIP